jgi:hypothetical protein
MLRLCVGKLYLSGVSQAGISVPDCPSDAFATTASPCWVTGRAVAGHGIAPIPGVAVAGGSTGKGTGSLTESWMRELDNQVSVLSQIRS